MKNKGFIAILTVTALLALSLSLVVAVAYLSIGESQSSFALSQGANTLFLTEGCVEDALLQAIRSENYDGGNYSYLDGVCRVDISKESATWTMNVSGTKDNFTRSIAVIFDYVPGPPGSITLRSWLEQ